MIIFVIILILGFILVGMAVFLSNRKLHQLDVFCGILGGFTIMLSVANIDRLNTPSALDVYRGKTLMEITQKDSTTLDSVVVWKHKTTEL